jgi:hypothetical protein
MLTSFYLNFTVPLFRIGHAITNEHKPEHKLCLSVSTLSGHVYLSEKPSLPDFIRTNRSPVGNGEVWAETYSAAAPGGQPGTIMRA